jgi:uncharacterized protein YcbK (DUF882 family)
MGCSIRYQMYVKLDPMRLLGTVTTFLVFSLAAAPGARANDLRATTESQLIQNRQADEDNLSRIEDSKMLDRFVRLKLLTTVPNDTQDYYLANVPSGYRYARPWTKLFIERLGSQYRGRFGTKLRVTSLVRTISLQNSLRRRNTNAASPYGEKRSTHLTGASIDISKKGMTRAQQDWMRGVLRSLREQGYIFAIEEFRQPAFHIMVYRQYEDYVDERLAAAEKRGDTSAN